MNIATSELEHLREEVKNCHHIIKNLQKKREFVGLTDEEATKVYAEIQEKVDEHWNKGGTTMMFPPTLYKAIEAKLKELNT